jgi:hypothetical protein
MSSTVEKSFPIMACDHDTTYKSSSHYSRSSGVSQVFWIVPHDMKHSTYYYEVSQLNTFRGYTSSQVIKVCEFEEKGIHVFLASSD